MKNKLYKRIAAAIVAVAMVSGAAPADLGHIGLFDRSTLTASAEGSHDIISRGAVSTDGNAVSSTITIDKETAAAGETVTITVNTAEGETPYNGVFNGNEIVGGLYVSDEHAESVPLTEVIKNNKYTFTMPDENVGVGALFEAPSQTISEYTIEFEDLDTYSQRGNFEYGRLVINPSNHEQEVAGTFSPAHEGDTIRVIVDYSGWDTRYIVGSMYYSYTDSNNETQTVEIPITNEGNLLYMGEFTMPAYDVSIGLTYQDAHAVKLDSIGHVLTPDKYSAVTGDMVTLTASKGYVINTIEIKCGDSDPIDYTDNHDGTYSFYMPDGDVTVSADYERECYYVNRYWGASSEEVISSEKDISLSSLEYLTPGSTYLGDGHWYYASGDITISGRVTIGGTVNIILEDGATLNCPKGIAVNEGSTLNIYGQKNDSGKIVAGSDKKYAAIGSDKETGCGTINIYGGTIEATSADEAAGIGGGNKAGNGEINIYGGTVTAKGGKHGAGIGTGNEPETQSELITIYGGTVTANGKEGAAGIGSGFFSKLTSDITINGGTVTAKGDTYGAGIGRGADSNKIDGKGTITINGGVVNATGGECSAGIGGGVSSTINITGGNIVAQGGCCEEDALVTMLVHSCPGIGSYAGTNSKAIINISGGTVKAYGGQNDEYYHYGAAGIGACSARLEFGGNFEGSIRITGGDVYAEGSGYWKNGKAYGAAGIGAGYKGNMTGTIDISGGTVEAVGVCGGAAIGAGTEEAEFNIGGECEGTIRITGGTVKTKLVKYCKQNETNPPVSFIGRGYEGDTDGTFELGTDMMVHFENVTPYSKMLRAGVCRTSSDTRLIIEKCSHAYKTYTSTDTHHTANCLYCFANLPTESHSLDENNRCTVCGYQGQLCTVNYDANGGSGSMDSVKIVPGYALILPECGFTAPEGYRFRCWSVNGEEIDAGDVITVSENTIIKATYSELTHHDAVAADYKNEGNIEYYTDEQGNNYILDGTDYVPVDSVTIPKLQIYMQVGLKSENSGSLDLNLLVPLPDDADPSDGYTFRFGDAETSFADCDTVTIDGRTCYLIRMTSAAKEMADEFEYAVLQNGTELMTDTTSVRAYVDAVLKGDYSDNVKNTCRAMLSYGAAAQAYFDHNTGNPANDGLEGTGADYEDVTISGSIFDKAALNEALTDAPVTYSQMTLSLDADTTLSLYFKVSDGADQADAQAYIEENFTLDGEAVTAEANGTQYVVIRKTGITISDLLNEYALSFSGKDYMVSAGQYLCAASQRGSDNLKSLAKALYNYYLYATNQAEGA